MDVCETTCQALPSHQWRTEYALLDSSKIAGVMRHHGQQNHGAGVFSE
jgi:hypothetical protein